MDRLISCKFNMDTACVELKFFDGSKIAIDTFAVENEVADNMYQRSELDYLIYNDPIGHGLSGILGLRQIVILANFNPTFPLNL